MRGVIVLSNGAATVALCALVASLADKYDFRPEPVEGPASEPAA